MISIENVRIDRSFEYSCMYRARLGDTAVAHVQNTITDGTIDMISRRGLNLRDHSGKVYFVKWYNIIRIIRG